MKILDSLDRFQGRSRFTTWAMTIATRIGISELRRRHYRNVSLDSITADDSLKLDVPVENEPAAEDQLDRANILRKLGEQIESLTDKQKLAVRGLLEGLPIEEIADRMGSNRNAVYKLVHDARQRLRRQLEDAGVSAHDVNVVFA